MNAFAGDALFAGLKEGCKLAGCALLAVSLFNASGRPSLKRPLYAGIAAVLLGAVLVFVLPSPPRAREFVSDAVGYVFGLCYLLALVMYALRGHATIEAPSGVRFAGGILLAGLVAVLTVLYFLPDVVGSSFYLRELFGMSGGSLAVLIAGGAGFAAGVAAVKGLARRARIDPVRFFGWPQFVLLLAMVKLFGGGLGFAEFSLIPSVQRGLMKFVHDFVHHVLVTLMVPDHQVLSVTAWNFIGLLFGDTLALWLSLAIFTAPLLFVLRAQAAMPVPVPWDIPAGASSRMYRKSVRDARTLRSLPVVLFLIVIAATWFVERGETGIVQIDPPPVPVVAQNGKAIIPLSTPGRELRDGGMHKFSLEVNGEPVRLLIMKRSDGMLAVCLDACEICPPEGYVLRKNHVVCRYCSTPIPVDSLGQRGGCNPIPVRAIVTERDVVVDVSDIAAAWNKVKAKQGSRGQG